MTGTAPISSISLLSAAYNLRSHLDKLASVSPSDLMTFLPPKQTEAPGSAMPASSVSWVLTFMFLIPRSLHASLSTFTFTLMKGFCLAGLRNQLCDDVSNTFYYLFPINSAQLSILSLAAASFCWTCEDLPCDLLLDRQTLLKWPDFPHVLHVAPLALHVS